MQLCVNSKSPCLLLSLVTVDRMAMCLYLSVCFTYSSFVPRLYLAPYSFLVRPRHLTNLLP